MHGKTVIDWDARDETMEWIERTLKFDLREKHCFRWISFNTRIGERLVTLIMMMRLTSKSKWTDHHAGQNNQ